MKRMIVVAKEIVKRRYEKYQRIFESSFLDSEELLDQLIEFIASDEQPQHQPHLYIQRKMTVTEMFLLKIGLMDMAVYEGTPSSLMYRLLEKLESSRRHLCFSTCPFTDDFSRRRALAHVIKQDERVWQLARDDGDDHDTPSEATKTMTSFMLSDFIFDMAGGVANNFEAITLLLQKFSAEKIID